MSTSTPNHLRTLARLTALIALSNSCLAAGPALPASPPPAASEALPKVCLQAESGDPLTREFADRLRQTIDASRALRLAPTGDSCDLRLHVPGNLLRFETAAGVMVSTVVIVTSASGRYLSTSISACQANQLEPCAARALDAAKLALLIGSSDPSAGAAD